MRIFLTGATGYIGAAVLDALVRGGHDVTALVRDNEKARRVAKRGAHPVIGNLAEPDSFRGSADAQDGYVHAAFDSSSGRGPAIEQAALETILTAARRPRTAGANAPGTRFVIYTSGVWVLGKTPEPAGVAFACTPEKNRICREHMKQVVDPFLKSLRGKVGLVAYSLPGSEDPIRKKMYRSIRATPTEDERQQGLKELESKLQRFSYQGQPLELKDTRMMTVWQQVKGGWVAIAHADSLQ